MSTRANTLIFVILIVLCRPSGAVSESDTDRESSGAADFARWARRITPASGAPEPIGEFAAGCLRGAIAVRPTGAHYALMRLKRRRNFGHPAMQTYLDDLGRRLEEKHLPYLLVGDIGPARGGPSLTGHASHQTGLDVDLWLRMSSRPPGPRDRERWGAPSFVVKRRKLTQSWGKKQTELVRAAANSDLVNRIFVSPPIKRYFCARFAGAPWLYKLRAWWGHEEHIHVRLNCPSDARQCVSQSPVNPSDPGCGKELDWWFSAEADAKWKEIRADKSPRSFPKLPDACSSVVGA